jgi:hypothetical protein
MTTIIYIYIRIPGEKQKKTKNKMTRESRSQWNDSRMYMNQECVHDVKRRTKRELCIKASSHDIRVITYEQFNQMKTERKKCLFHTQTLCAFISCAEMSHGIVVHGNVGAEMSRGTIARKSRRGNVARNCRTDLSCTEMSVWKCWRRSLARNCRLTD